MKGLVIIIIVLLSMSCQIAWEISDEIYYSQIEVSDIEKFELPQFVNSNFSIAMYIRDLIEFRIIENEIPSVQTVLEQGYGDCTGFCVIFINIYYQIHGEKCNMVFVEQNRGVVNGGEVDHAVVELPDGTLIEPQTGKAVNYNIGYRYKFNELFY